MTGAVVFVLLLGMMLGEGAVPCHQKVCQSAEYCQELDRTCQPCEGICTPDTHNYSRGDCLLNCKDYLKREQQNDVDELKKSVQQLSKMVTVSLTFSALILLTLLAVLLLQLYRWTKKNNITFASIKQRVFKQKTTPNNAYNASKDVKKQDLKLDIQAQSEAHSDHSPVTITTSISRRPAEDSTLDYAYDNPAMTQNSNRY